MMESLKLVVVGPAGVSSSANELDAFISMKCIYLIISICFFNQ